MSVSINQINPWMEYKEQLNEYINLHVSDFGVFVLEQ